MTGKALWAPLREELQRWQDAGLTAQLWLRDDDAIGSTPLLDRLIALTDEFDVPVTLAVIPAKTNELLAHRLANASHIHPAVHGWAHENHAPPGEKRQELGHRPRTVIASELEAALRRLKSLYGSRLMPMLVPPWNHIDPELLHELPSLGFSALSAFGHKLAANKVKGLVIANTHVDIIDFRNGPACRDHGWLVSALSEELATARLAGGPPVGVLSHHLVSDDAAFGFLADLFAVTRDMEATRWLSPHDLLARVRPSD